MPTTHGPAGRPRYTRDDAERIALYRPRIEPDVWEKIAPFVRAVVTDALGSTRYETYKLLTVATAHARFVWRTGRGLEDRRMVFDRAVIEDFIANGCAQYAPATRKAWRLILYRIGEHAAGIDYSEFFERRSAEHTARLAPYTPAEIVSLRNLFHSRSRLTPLQRTARLAIPLGSRFRSRPVPG